MFSFRLSLPKIKTKKKGDLMKNLDDAQKQLLNDATKLMLKNGQVAMWLERAKRMGVELIRPVHAELDQRVQEMCRHPGHNQHVLAQMKRLKLRLKEIIEKTEEAPALVRAA